MQGVGGSSPLIFTTFSSASKSPRFTSKSLLEGACVYIISLDGCQGFLYYRKLLKTDLAVCIVRYRKSVDRLSTQLAKQAVISGDSPLFCFYAIGNCANHTAKKGTRTKCFARVPFSVFSLQNHSLHERVPYHRRNGSLPCASRAKRIRVHALSFRGLRRRRSPA